MATYLLKWNPKSELFQELDRFTELIKVHKSVRFFWESGFGSEIKTGDRVFFQHVGTKTPGIFGSGIVYSAGIGQNRRFKHEVDFTVLLHPTNEKIFPREYLNKGILMKMTWDNQGGGRIIRDDIAKQLEIDWTHFLVYEKDICEIGSEELLLDQSNYSEGGKRRIEINIYERDPKARNKCLQHYGYNCVICNFNFGECFGEIGDNFIHVHHLLPLSKIGTAYKVDPINDLRPVCPNCHSIIHRKKIPYTIEEMKNALNQNKLN